MVGQELIQKGVPPITNFIPNTYLNKGKIWDIQSSPTGLIYMAADKGLLEFDGKSWRGFQGSAGFTRSVTVVNDSLIYTGSDLDFGVWNRNKYHELQYTSLYPFKKDLNEENEEFWHVHQVNEGVAFVSFQNIYLYKNEQLIKIQAPSRFESSFDLDGTIYLSDGKQSLFKLNGQKLDLVFTLNGTQNFEIVGIANLNKDLLIVTKNDGLFTYKSGQLYPSKSELSKLLKIAKVFSFTTLRGGNLAFGTVLDGLVITDSSEHIIHYINKNKGLLNNTVLSLYQSSTGMLWMGLDYGLSALNLHSDISYFLDYTGGFGTGYAATKMKSNFYLGTNQGLYQCNWEDLNNNNSSFQFKLIPGTEGQVWTLKVQDEKLLIGHDKGLFEFDEKKLKQINSNEGVWEVIPFRDFLLTGNYNGISIFKKEKNNWVIEKKMELILGSCNQLVAQNDQILWINIPNFGVIRATLDQYLAPSGRLIFEENNFTGSNFQIFKEGDSVQIVTDQMHYLFDEASQKFEAIEKPDWIKTPRVELLAHPVMSAPLDSFYEFYPVYNGFAIRNIHFNPNQYATNTSLIFRQFEAFNNNEKKNIPFGAVIPNDLNNIRIEYIVPLSDRVLYQYRSNLSKEWTELSEDNTLELLNLKPGKYTINVRALIDNNTSSEAVMTFQIKKPWYLSWLAFFIYFILSIFLLLFAYKAHHNKLKHQKLNLLRKERNSLRLQAAKHRQQLAKIEQEKLQKEYESLKEQLKSKTIELANKAKENEDKNRLLLSIKEKLITVQEKPSLAKRIWNEVNSLLDSYLEIEDNTFELQMDELYQDFFKKLKMQFPGLSSYDLRLCAYLKVGLNSREIADILNIQPSSSYISRSRLRKKLNLSPEEDLFDFLNKI